MSINNNSKLNNCRAFIFDMDGTLVDSLDVWVQADKRFIASLGYEYDESHSRRMKKMHFDSACQYLIEEFELQMPAEEVAEKIFGIVADCYLNEVALKPFAREFLQTRRDRGVKMCVATSNKKKLAEGLVKKLGVDDCFEFILTSDEVGSGKESPDIFLEAARRLGFEPAQTAVFEDSLHAAQTAANAGFCTVGVYDNFSAAEFDLLTQTCDMVIKSYGEII